MSLKKEATTIPDLCTLDVKTGADAGYDLEILTPSGMRSSFVFKILGRDSEKYQNMVLAIQRRRVAAVEKTGKIQDVEAFRDDANLLLAEATVSWSKFMLDGKEFPHTKENALRIYSDPRFIMIREQVDSAINTRANFIKA